MLDFRELGRNLAVGAPKSRNPLPDWLHLKVGSDFEAQAVKTSLDCSNQQILLNLWNDSESMVRYVNLFLCHPNHFPGKTAVHYDASAEIDLEQSGSERGILPSRSTVSFGWHVWRPGYKYVGEQSQDFKIGSIGKQKPVHSPRQLFVPEGRCAFQLRVQVLMIPPGQVARLRVRNLKVNERYL